MMNETAENPTVPLPAPSGEPLARAPRRVIWTVLALLLLAALIWQQIDLRRRIAAAGDEVARQAATTADLKAQLVSLRDSAVALQQKTAVLDARLGDFRAQQATLDELYQDLARGREAWLLIEVEQLIGIAAQQLQLAGDVQTAIQALTTADLRLARSQRPQLIALRKAVAQDLARLKAAPTVDLAGAALRIENLTNTVDAMGLAYESRPPVAAARAAAPKGAEPKVDGAGEPVWQRGLREFWAEVRGLVRIERIDRPEPAVLAPSQVFFLRENLKLRLLSARVELLSRDQAAFRSELKLALQWLERHFDARDRRVQVAIDTLKPMLSADFTVEPPTLAASQAALRGLKLPAERAAR